jgi:Mlc titration factor MtfA (ptsG expression regulator)
METSVTKNLLVLVLEFPLNLFSRLLSILFDRTPTIHHSRRKRKLSRVQKEILVQEVDFYQKLNSYYQAYFEHRVANFIRTYVFIGRDGYEINAETKVLLGASYIMLTFGKRKYITDVFDKIIIYPDIFLSTITKKMHKGEFNPQLKTVVFSWKHFKEGNLIKNDNLNLGIHEFTHIVHIKSMKRNDESSVVFKKEYKK